MNFINDHSSFPRLEHEPLNAERVWGDIHKEYLGTGSLSGFRDGLSVAIEAKPNIKHCFELFDPTVTMALIGECFNAGYTVFLLTRRDEASRLKSLVLALITDAWWKPEASKTYPGLINNAKPLPAFDLDKLRAIAANEKSSLAALLSNLKSSRASFARIFFEDFFGTNANAQESASRLLRSIGITPVSQPINLDYLNSAWAQKSDEILPLISNYPQICALLAEIAPYSASAIEGQE